MKIKKNARIRKSIRLSKADIALIKSLEKNYSLNAFVKETRALAAYKFYIKNAADQNILPSEAKDRIVTARNMAIKLKESIKEDYLGQFTIVSLNSKLKISTLTTPSFSHNLEAKLKRLGDHLTYSKIQDQIGLGYFTELQNNTKLLIDATRELTAQIKNEVNKAIAPYVYQSEKFLKCLEIDLENYIDSLSKNISPVKQGRPFETLITNILVRIMDYFEKETKQKIKISSTGVNSLAYKGIFCNFIAEYLPVINKILGENISQQKLLNSAYSTYKNRKKI